MVALHVGLNRKIMAADEWGLRQFGWLCVRQGVTTAADLANPLPTEAVDMMLRVTGEADFPVRIVSLLRFQGVMDFPGKSRGTFDILTVSGGPNEPTKTTRIYR